MYALDIQNLTKRYKNGVQALKGINLTVEEGDFFGLLGSNGAGKSTTINVLCSLVKKTSGTVKLFDVDIDDDFLKAKSYLGVVPQEFNFSIFETVQHIILQQAGYYGIPHKLAKIRVEKYLKLLELWDKRNELARTLSGGMKRRVMIARALVHEPKLLILDEPTAGVDIEIRRSMWNFLREINDNGTTIILTTHYLEEAEALCRNIAIINEGVVIEHASTHDLLHTLDVETFVLDLKEPCMVDLSLECASFKRKDPVTLEVEVAKCQDMNTIFHYLDQKDIKVLSMRNKANRLEELFLNRTNQQ